MGAERLPRNTAARAGEPAVPLEAYLNGPLGPYLATATMFDLSRDPGTLPAPGSQQSIWARWLLQDIGDYRGALQSWLNCLGLGGFLVITVPHAFLYERQDAAPSLRRHPQRRLYTPRALAEEIEEALVPNSYRLRWLGDLDAGYDYQVDVPLGQHDVAAVIERIAAPDWGLTEQIKASPPPVDLFESDRTRVELTARPSGRRILALKLDHLGDFIMGIPALKRLRDNFPEAEITLVVGSWNESLARSLGVADRVEVFDAFPRNSAEEEPDVPGKAALFDAQITGSYDLVVDLRTDMDSRLLLRNIDAAMKAGIGLQSRFPFLDICLPLDTQIQHFDAAWAETIDPPRFSAQSYCRNSPYSIHCPGGEIGEEGPAIIWGPYRALPPGDYLFEPFLEIESGHPGLIACDIALDTQRVAYAVSDTGVNELRFTSVKDQALFEFRLFPVPGQPVADVRFYGGRLSKRGTASALHQSEYLILLVDLVALRLNGTGIVGDIGL